MKKSEVWMFNKQRGLRKTILTVKYTTIGLHWLNWIHVSLRPVRMASTITWDVNFPRTASC